MQTIRNHKKPLIFLGATWGIYFTFLFSRILQWTPEGLYGGHVNVWSDWSIHIAMVNLFAYKSPLDWFAYHPLYSEGKFTYPFLTNLISGLFVRAGVPLIPAMTIPSIIYSFLLLAGLYLCGYLFLKSKRQAILAVFIFLLSSGPGFLNYLKNLAYDFQWATAIFPSIDYSRIDQRQWYAGNVIEGLLVPQRAFLLGMTLASWGLYGFFCGLQNLNFRPESETSPDQTLARKYWIFSGILIGLLSFTHVHSLIAIAPGVALVVLYQIYRHPRTASELPYLIGPASALVLVYYFAFLRGGIQTTHFQSWNPGWTSEGGVLGWLLLWFKIWGLTLPLALWGFVNFVFLEKNNPPAFKIFLGSFFLLFGLANLIFFQPIAWDNSKLFFWCYLMFSILLSRLLATLCKFDRKWAAPLAGILLLSLTGTGILECYRMQWISRNRFLMTDRENINLGEEIRKSTGSRDIFLTSPDHNQFIMMWGLRPITMGYTAWVGNYGFNYEQTERDLNEIYLGATRSKQLLAQHHIHYVVIGAGELRLHHANEGFFAQSYRLAFTNKNYRIYDVLSPKL